MVRKQTREFRKEIEKRFTACRHRVGYQYPLDATEDYSNDVGLNVIIYYLLEFPGFVKECGGVRSAQVECSSCNSCWPPKEVPLGEATAPLQDG